MVSAARKTGNRTAERDALLIMLAYRHGLRASELTALRWDQVDLKVGLLHVARLKRGDASTHPLRGPDGHAQNRLTEAHFNLEVEVGSCKPQLLPCAAPW